MNHIFNVNMKQTTLDTGWVFIVLHSDKLHYQIFSDKMLTRRKPRWLRVLLQAFATGRQLYGLTL